MTDDSADRTPFPPSESKRRLARTYADSGWDGVREYDAAMRWHAAHPQQGSYVASRALDLPRGRLRAWFDGAKPEAVRAIDTAESRGWLDATPGDLTFEGLSVLHAWILAGGSIAQDTFVPSLAVGPADPGGLARDAFAATGIRSRRVNESTAERATEIRPDGPGRSHLGRFLHGVLGAPVGDKTQVGAEPLAYLASVPKMTLLRWCQTYVTLRGSAVELARGGRTVRLGERRSREYRRALADRLRAVVGDDAHVTVTDYATVLGADTLGMLDVAPALPSDD